MTLLMQRFRIFPVASTNPAALVKESPSVKEEPMMRHISFKALAVIMLLADMAVARTANRVTILYDSLRAGCIRTRTKSRCASINVPPENLGF
jgi:hypothetical protein